MPKTSKLSKSDKALTLFQNKKFTAVFFLAVFALLGGAFYLMQSSAYTTIAFNGCTVSGSGVSKGFTVEIRDFNTGQSYGTTKANNRGNFSLRARGIANANTPVSIWEYSRNKGGGGALDGQMGPCL